MKSRVRSTLTLVSTLALFTPGILDAGPAAAAIEAMSPAALRQCGLDKLTPAELGELKLQLDRALAEDGSTSPAPAADLPRGADAFGREEELKAKVEMRQEIPDSIRDRIAGEFRGWSGQTVFRLQNGQVWRQVGEGAAYARMDSPEVTIERGSMGSFFLRVAGLGARVKVKRLK